MTPEEFDKWMLRAPVLLNAGPYVYSIAYDQTAELASAQKFGETNHGQRLIRICEMSGRRQIAETLLHEMIHVAFELTIPRAIKSDDEDEPITRQLSIGIAMMMRYNPSMMSWISEGLEDSVVPPAKNTRAPSAKPKRHADMRKEKP